MITFNNLFLISVFVLSTLVHKSTSIHCYQCHGTNSSARYLFQCNEWLDSDTLLEPESCDTVYGAKYCVKQVGRYEGKSINCYQCSTSNTIDCTDVMIEMNAMKPKDCNDVFEAQYCIKSISLEGGVGTRRFCSSMDLGNYCNYVQQPGDLLNYRTCIYTCSTDGCNYAGRPFINNFIILISILIIILPIIK